MELDDLKKSWEILDKRLKKNELIDEQTLNTLIHERTKQTRNSMDKMLLYGRTTLIIGLIVTIGLGYYVISRDCCTKGYHLWLYLWCILCFGMIWDGIGYFYLRSIDIERMPLVKVVKKITAYNRNFMIECYVAAIFIISAIFIQAASINLLELSFAIKIIFVVVWIIGCFTSYWIIKRLYYDKLKDIKRNISELKELKQDKK